MRTGIWSWLTKGKQTDSTSSFGQNVLKALHNCKGSTEEEQKKELKGVFDSCSILKDCEKKNTLLNIVRDCYDSRDKAFENEEALVKTLDSMYQQIVADSDKDFEDKKEPKKEDADKSEKDENKDSEDEKGPKKDGCKDSEDEKEPKKGEQKNKDSILSKEEIAQAVKDSMLTELKELVPSLVKETLGIKESKKDTSGVQLDSNTSVSTRDYSEFLE